MTDYAALLRAIAIPRLTGTVRHAAVRALLEDELAARGFVVIEHRFSRLSVWRRRGRAPLAGVNLIAVRPQARVATWLVAHYDSKGQPLSMAARLLAAILVALGAFELLGILVRLALGSWHTSPLDAVLGAGGVVGVLLLAGNRVTDRSPGAVDNATGILTALAVLDLLPPGVAIGVIFPDAEEYGLVGARALVRERANLIRGTTVINFDGIDDHGATLAWVHRRGPTVDAVVREVGARRARWLPLVVDGLALAAVARECVTIVRGAWGTARVVHTPRDGAARLTLAGTRDVAQGVAAALARGAS